MNLPSNRFNIHTAIIFTIAVLLVSGCSQVQENSFTLDNGMQVILMENHNSPMIASMIFIKSGSKYESKFENGATHFLEHFLFVIEGPVEYSQ